jgi:hypothetical protein
MSRSFDAYVRAVYTALRASGTPHSEADLALRRGYLQVSTGFSKGLPVAAIARKLTPRRGLAGGSAPRSVAEAVGCKVAPIEAFFVEPDDLPPLPTCRLRRKSGLVAGGFDVYAQTSTVGRAEFERQLRAIFGEEVVIAELEDVYSVRMPGGFYQRCRADLLAIGKDIADVTFSVDTGSEVKGLLARRFIRHKGRVYAYHAIYDIDSGTNSNAARGLAAEATRKSLKWYRASGVDSVLTHAAWVGRYVWASFGFNWDGAEASFKQKEFFSYLDGHRQALQPRGWIETATSRVEFNDIRDWEEFDEAVEAGSFTDDSWRAASLRMLDLSGREVHVGKDFLMGTHLSGKRFSQDNPGAKGWDGTLSLDPSSPSYKRAARRLKL